jgi:uncharacterized protein (DUF952 family)
MVVFPCAAALEIVAWAELTQRGPHRARAAQHLRPRSAKPSVPTVYKICELSEWQAAESAGVFAGSAVDARDGFIHLSTAAQVTESAAKHFAGVSGLLLVAVDADLLGDALRWEPARGGQLFPHLYGALPLAAVLWAKPVGLGSDGRHVFSDLVL